jgi:hypothetical protein
VTVTVLVAVRLPASFTLTWKAYVPAFENVTIVALAAFVPLAVNDTAAGGVPVVAQVYVRAVSPLSSAPSTERAAVVAVTVPGLAEAAVAIVGAVLTWITVIDAIALTVPLVAVIV